MGLEQITPDSWKAIYLVATIAVVIIWVKVIRRLMERNKEKKK